MSHIQRWRSRLGSLPESLQFSRFPIDSRTVFHASEFSFAFTNLKPVIPGHVLVSPIRVVDRLTHLTSEEVADLFQSARLVGDAILKAHPHADSLTFTVQDGPSAGQTVKHVHIHIMPRWATDRFNLSARGNDSVYEEINDSDKGMNGPTDSDDPKEGLHVDECGTARSKEDMIAEGQHLRSVVEEILAAQG